MVNSSKKITGAKESIASPLALQLADPDSILGTPYDPLKSHQVLALSKESRVSAEHHWV